MWYVCVCGWKIYQNNINDTKKTKTKKTPLKIWNVRPGHVPRYVAQEPARTQTNLDVEGRLQKRLDHTIPKARKLKKRTASVEGMLDPRRKEKRNKNTGKRMEERRESGQWVMW